MQITGLHILLDLPVHFRVRSLLCMGSPRQEGVLTLAQVEEILDEAREAGVEWIYFEGGEPFLYYPILLPGVYMAAAQGFKVGIVSNAFWAVSVAVASEWLRPMAGRLL